MEALATLQILQFLVAVRRFFVHDKKEEWDTEAEPLFTDGIEEEVYRVLREQQDVEMVRMVLKSLNESKNSKHKNDETLLKMVEEMSDARASDKPVAPQIVDGMHPVIQCSSTESLLAAEASGSET